MVMVMGVEWDVRREVEGDGGGAGRFKDVRLAHNWLKIYDFLNSSRSGFRFLEEKQRVRSRRGTMETKSTEAALTFAWEQEARRSLQFPKRQVCFLFLPPSSPTTSSSRTTRSTLTESQAFDFWTRDTRLDGIQKACIARQNRVRNKAWKRNLAGGQRVVVLAGPASLRHIGFFPAECRLLGNATNDFGGLTWRGGYTGSPTRKRTTPARGLFLNHGILLAYQHLLASPACFWVQEIGEDSRFILRGMSIQGTCRSLGAPRLAFALVLESTFGTQERDILVASVLLAGTARALEDFWTFNTIGYVEDSLSQQLPFCSTFFPHRRLFYTTIRYCEISELLY
ncbi:hypothetical protein BDZ89DRAFT_1117393 [Hymenopellis radicata]|nr:hypothetical protein BDZ89DRAFT_1117393 [Hymenopellis radicata]